MLQQYITEKEHKVITSDLNTFYKFINKKPNLLFYFCIRFNNLATGGKDEVTTFFLTLNPYISLMIEI